VGAAHVSLAGWLTSNLTCNMSLYRLKLRGSKLAKRHVVQAPPNKSLQRSGTHKLLGRGRPSRERTRALRARVLRGRRAAAELSR
jgi:hypothetical protein